MEHKPEGGTKLMAEITIPAVISIDTDTVHFYITDPEGRSSHVSASYRPCPFDDDFFSKLDKLIKAYLQKNPMDPAAKISLVLPDHLFFTDIFNIPTLGRRAVDRSFELAFETVYLYFMRCQCRTDTIFAETARFNT